MNSLTRLEKLLKNELKEPLKQDVEQPKVLTNKEENRIMMTNPRLKFIEELSCGHTYVWRLNHADRRFSNYIYTIRFVASLRDKLCYRRYVEKLLKCLLHDTRVSTSRKYEVLFYLYYYSTWVWPKSDKELWSYFSEFI